MRITKRQIVGVTIAALAVAASLSTSQAPIRAASQQAYSVDSRITTPKAEWGHNVGDDYFLANYQQLMAYWKKLDQESDRLQVVEIGQSALKRPQLDRKSVV